jgi:hypothetical protein
MVLSNAERQRRWRAKRNILAGEARQFRNAPLDHLIADHEKRGAILPRERKLTVQRLLKGADPEEDAELIDWLQSWLPPKRRKGAKP